MTHHPSLVVRRAGAVGLGTVTLVLFIVATLSLAAQEPVTQHPVITGAGGVQPLPAASEQPMRNAKVLFDITNQDLSTALGRPARLLNLYGLAGMRPGTDYRVSIVLHGRAVAGVLTDAARTRHGLPANDARALIETLAAHGVELLVCGQALLDQGYKPEDVLPVVRVALSAMTVVVNKHTQGYAYLQIP